jgi:hypothetical protein
MKFRMNPQKWMFKPILESLSVIRMIHISDFYQMFQSLKQFLEDYVPKQRHAKFQAGWCP